MTNTRHGTPPRIGSENGGSHIQDTARLQEGGGKRSETLPLKLPNPPTNCTSVDCLKCAKLVTSSRAWQTPREKGVANLKGREADHPPHPPSPKQNSFREASPDPDP